MSKELKEKLMEMPDLETQELEQEWHSKKGEFCGSCFRDHEGKPEEIHKELNSINTFYAYKNEVCIIGTDEDNKSFSVRFDSYNFIQWIEHDTLKYIKEQLIKHINVNK